MIIETRSSETSILTRATQRNVAEDSVHLLYTFDLTPVSVDSFPIVTRRVTILNLKGSDDGDRQKYWGSGLLPQPGLLYTRKRFENWMCFRPQVRGRRYLLCWVP
jgi:hypothetical protein